MVINNKLFLVLFGLIFSSCTYQPANKFELTVEETELIDTDMDGFCNKFIKKWDLVHSENIKDDYYNSDTTITITVSHKFNSVVVGINGLTFDGYDNLKSQLCKQNTCEELKDEFVEAGYIDVDSVIDVTSILVGNGSIIMTKVFDRGEYIHSFVYEKE
jgi:hypothetical protein